MDLFLAPPVFIGRRARMRRIVFLSLGILESFASLVLFFFAHELPGSEEVQDGVGRVERVSRQTTAQVQRLRNQVATLRERRPQLQEMAVRLQKQMRLVTDNLKDQSIDYDTVKTVGESLGDAADGLDGLSATLDPKAVAKIGEGFNAAAAFLDDQLAKAAEEMADRLDRSTDDLRTDAKRLAELLRQAPLDLKAAREVHDALEKFSEGLDRISTPLKKERIAAMREGFKGLEDSLTTGAEQVERLAGYTYPVVMLNGLRVTVEQRQFWPEGERIAEGMRKAAKGTTAAGKELDALVEDLPKIQASLDESRKVVRKSRDALANALKQQAQVEPLMKDIPAHAARLAEELPQLGAGLSKTLRDTSRLKELAGLLRQAQKGIETTVERWPELRKNLGRSAALLRLTQGQLRHAVEHRAEYEASMQQTLVLAKTFSAALPLLTEQLDEELRDQEQSLTGLEASIGEVGVVLPVYARTASRVLVTTRLLLVLVGVIFAVHGGYLVLERRRPMKI
jgi:uncharacterized phage infection (PIP) family protein YhgE